MKDKSKKKNISLNIASLLLIFTLFSVHFAGNLYARYIVSANSKDASRVAKFNIEQSADFYTEELQIAIAPGEYTYEFEITNKSEVDVYCSIFVQNNTDNLPLYFCIHKKSDTGEHIVYFDNFKFEDAFDVGGSETYILKVYWDNENAQQYMNMLDLIDLTILTEQID